jgi:hypothetical protein
MNAAPNISALAREHGVSRKTIRRRLAAGWRPGASSPAPTLGVPMGAPETATETATGRDLVAAAPSSPPIPLGAPVGVPGHDAPTPMGGGPTRLEVLAPAPSPSMILAPVVFVLGLATAAVGLWLNASFLWAFGRTSDAGVMLAVIGGITDIATLVLPPTLVGLWARRRFVLTGTALAVYLLAVVMTALASLGFASTHIGDAVTGRSDTTEQRAALLDELARRKAERAGLAGFTPTSTQAVTAAEIARNQECGRVGPNCRARVAELNAALRDRALTEHAAELETAIATLSGKLDHTPAIKTADPQVESAVRMIAWASRGTITPSAGDVEMLRLLGVALMPILGGLLLAFAMALAQPAASPTRLPRADLGRFAGDRRQL